MEKAKILETLKLVKESSNKRNFKQTIDLIINVDLDLKKQDNRVDIYSQLHFDRGKKVKICGLIGPELSEQSKKHFDTTIMVDDFSKYKDKAVIRKLAKTHDFFVAQANIMPKVAATFGRVLGPRAKMPNPKAGCVVPPNANLEALSKKLQKTVRTRFEKYPIFQTSVGKEDMDENQVADNILTLYNSVIHHIPNEANAVRSVYLKLTMGKAIKIGEDAQTAGEKPKEENKEKKEKPAEKETTAEKTEEPSSADEDKSEDTDKKSE